MIMALYLGRPDAKRAEIVLDIFCIDITLKKKKIKSERDYTIISVFRHSGKKKNFVYYFLRPHFRFIATRATLALLTVVGRESGLKKSDLRVKRVRSSRRRDTGEILAGSEGDHRVRDYSQLKRSLNVTDWTREQLRASERRRRFAMANNFLGNDTKVSRW